MQKDRIIPIISERRKKQGQAKAGMLINEMVKQQKTTIYGISDICKVIGTDSRTLLRSIGFLVYNHGSCKKGHFIEINQEEEAFIRKTMELAEEYKSLNKRFRKLVYLSFLGAIRND